MLRTEQLQVRIASFMLALKYFGSLPQPAGRFEEEVVEEVKKLGYVEEVANRIVRKGK